jgi:capsular polysaccharide biosynthesis protein
LSHGDDANRRVPVERSPASRETEIHDYLRLFRRRWWIIVLVPAFAAGIVAWSHSDDPVEYSATATVAARSLIGHVNSPYVGPNSTEEFAADFQATATEKLVVRAVSEATQVSADSIRDGLSVTPVSTTAGMSALIDVKYITTEKDRAGPVAKQIALGTLSALFEPAFRQAQIEAAAEAAATETTTEAPVGDGTTGSLDKLLQQPQTVTLYPTAVESTTQSVIREVQIAIGAGLFLAVFIVILADVLGPRSRLRESSRAAYEDEASSAETSHTASHAPASGAR